jgi:hypothetical protein
MQQWNEFWVGPAIMAAVILGLFLVGFRPKDEAEER